MPVSMICSSFLLSNLRRDMFTIKTGNHSRHPQHDLCHKISSAFYICKICGHSGFGPRFSCPRSCNFNLHEECCINFTYHTPFNFPPFLAGSNFVISRDPPQNLPCTACQLPIEGLYYHCNNRRTNLHLLCVRLRTTLTISGKQTTLKNRCNVRCSYRRCPERNGGWSYFSQNDTNNYHVACWKDMMQRPSKVYKPQKRQGLLEIHDKDGHPEHKLKLERSEVPFICGGCKELGFGLRYQCPNMNCNYILHEECGFGLEYRRPPTQKFFKRCDFQFHRQNSLPGTRICDICALDIQGFSYQCSHGNIDLHPHCAHLSLTITLPDSNEVIELRENTKSICLKCQRKKRASGKVQGLSYVSSDGNLCYHVACLKEACLDNWRRGYFQLDALANEESKILALQNLAPNQVVRPSKGQSSNAMKGAKLWITFLKLVVSAILGEPFTLVCALFQIAQN